MANEHHTVELTIEGMDCGNCALGIEKKLRSLGVGSPSVNFATKLARFDLPAGSSPQPVVAAIEALGYQIVAPSAPASRVRFSLEGKVAVCAAFTLPLFLGHMIPGMPHVLHNAVTQLSLCLPVFVIGLLHFGASALRSLKARFANMDVLIVIGLIASFGYSLYGTLAGAGSNFLFYETTATITTIVLLGNLIEARAVRRTSTAIEELGRLQPARARKIDRSDGSERLLDVDAASIVPGDLLRVATGDRIPADGSIVEGSAALDESMLTGESIPVDRAPGDRVIGGTIAVNGSIVVRADAVGEASVLARIIGLVKEAQTNKPSIQRLGDTVSSIFVPVTLVIAALTFIVSIALLELGTGEAILRAVAVLVIACPCAMGLATPTAVMVGVGRAARNGILLRGGSTLEEFAAIRTVVFDKTGTLTTGDFSLGDITVYEREESFVRSIVLSLEHHSAHPIAKSLVRTLSAATPISLTDVREEKGSGISGVDSHGRRYTFGSPTIAGIAPGEAPPGALYLLEEQTVIARLIVSDTVKPEAQGVIAELKRLGVTAVMLSGDGATRCHDVGALVGIDQIYSGQRPDDKLRVIDALERHGRVAFVGDGVNDAPALARASVGVSVSNGTSVAIESARIVLLGGALTDLPTALGLARETLRTIKQNLFWAFSYNIVAIPLAAAGYLTPALAAIAMGFSDVMTIGNSIRLRHKKLV